MSLLTKLIPQSTEAVVDNEVTVETKMAMSSIFTMLFVYAMKVPPAATIAQMAGITPTTAAGWGVALATAASIWICAFLHKHVYNGNAAPVVAAQMVSASPPAALKQATGTTVETTEVSTATTAVQTTQSTPVPNPSAPAAVTQPPAPPSPTTPPTSSASSQA